MSTPRLGRLPDQGRLRALRLPVLVWLSCEKRELPPPASTREPSCLTSTPPTNARDFDGAHLSHPDFRFPIQGIVSVGAILRQKQKRGRIAPLAGRLKSL